MLNTLSSVLENMTKNIQTDYKNMHDILYLAIMKPAAYKTTVCCTRIVNALL